MPQIITQLIHPNAINVNNLEQVAQISINNNTNTTIIEVMYNINNDQVVIRNNNNVYFYVTSPDTDDITIYDILTFLNYSSAHITLDYCEYGYVPISDVISIPVIDAPLSQMTVYPQIINNITLNTPEHTQTNNDDMILEQETLIHEHLVIDESFIDNPIDVTNIANLTPIVQIDSPVSFNYIDSFNV
jgi:hypothetical protein